MGGGTPPKVAFLEINSPLAVNVVFVGGGEMGRPSPQVPAIPIKPNERELKRFFAFLEKKEGREEERNKVTINMSPYSIKPYRSRAVPVGVASKCQALLLGVVIRLVFIGFRTSR